jgi:4-hydroxyphenylpyruvate dioxygenase-like putative hemolysin
MEKEKLLEGEATHICQVGVVVKDLDQTIAHLTSLGLGPFKVRTVYHPSATVRGEKASYQVRLAMAQQGPVQLELIEYQKGTTIQKEFLDQRGEGIHHLLFNVPCIIQASSLCTGIPTFKKLSSTFCTNVIFHRPLSLHLQGSIPGPWLPG